MCGICGKISFQNQVVQTEELHLMMDKIKHRGPDDQGVFLSQNVGFGFVRLSILDLSDAGHQPYKSLDGRYTLIFNGEIYNYLEIRAELSKEGFEFRTNTDTEVLLNAYLYWGEQAFHRFNGMWALAIHDEVEKSVFFSRDRFGIKPFYYFYSDEEFYFASEIPALLAVKKDRVEANVDTIHQYLVFNRTEHNEETFFKGIYKLLHGHQLKIHLNDTKQEIKPLKWYDLENEVQKSTGFKSASEYKDMLFDAVNLHLRSDVEIGLSLSGGLDSSSLASISKIQLNGKRLETFSAVYKNEFKEDEKKFVDEYSDEELHKNFVYPDAENLLEELDSYITCQAEPTPSTSPFAQYKVMQSAQKKVVVMLDGQGADEQLAGYHYFYGFYFKDLLRHFKLFKLVKEIFYYFKIHKSFFAIKTFLFFLLPSKRRTKYKSNEFGHLNKDFLSNYMNNEKLEYDIYSSKSLKAALLNHVEYKLEHLLKWEDRNSMHFSLEARVPFLDFRLVEKTLATNMNLIIHKGESKYILRQAMKNIIPEKIRLRQDKIGYVTPQDDWFRTDIWRDFILDVIQSESFKSRALFNSEKVLILYKNHLENKENISREIWKCVNLELWFRKYIDNE